MKRGGKAQLKDTAIPTFPHFASRKALLKNDTEKSVQDCDYLKVSLLLHVFEPSYSLSN